MRGVGRLASASPASASRPSFLACSSYAYSSFSGAGGRGRGRGVGPPISPSPLGKPPEEASRDDDGESDSARSGLGHGQSRPPPFPTFSWTSSPNPPTAPPSADAGRGGGAPKPPPLPRPPSPPPGAGRGRGGIGVPFSHPPSDPDGPKKPIFFRREDYAPDSFVGRGDEMKPPVGMSLPPGLSTGLSRGATGRGKPAGASSPGAIPQRPLQENRHLRPRSPQDLGPGRGRSRPASSPVTRTMGREEAAKNAMGILTRGGRGTMGRGLRGRGEGGGMAWRGRGGRFGGRGTARDPDEYYGTGLYMGDNADGEKLAKRLGEENMGKLKEAFEEMSGRVLPSPMEDAYLEGLHTNNSFEFEPEYHMVFNSNPDIDETPPISLPEALERMKPFLMEYEGIASQEEWEEVVKETMEKAPVLKGLVDFYSGPDRVTAEQQNKELDRVAKILPDNIPLSVKKFTDRAVLSLQSNPGWGFQKKYQFMDKLVLEVSQHYK